MPENTTWVPKPRILCTDDDADTREVLRLLLESEDFDVTCAEDSAETLSFAKTEKFDLFLLDSWLPQTDGSSLCKELRKLYATTPILFYSGAASPADKARALAAGADGYVTKPAEPIELAAEIRRLIKAIT